MAWGDHNFRPCDICGGDSFGGTIQAGPTGPQWICRPCYRKAREEHARSKQESADKPEWRWEDHPDTVLSDLCANGTCDRCPGTVACGHPCHTKKTPERDSMGLWIERQPSSKPADAKPVEVGQAAKVRPCGHSPGAHGPEGCDFCDCEGWCGEPEVGRHG